MADDNKGSEQILGEHSGVYIPNKDKDRQEISIDFGGFVVGLYQSALMSMGRMADPDGGQLPVDLEAAKHTIDIIRLLAQKTQGNLEPEEERLITGLLHELRVAYIEVSRK